MKRSTLTDRHITLAAMILVTTLFVARAIVFAGMHGGIEHDSGWFMGVARNLAEHGVYASSTNTTVFEGAGVNPGIFGRPSVQDSRGFMYFPAGVTAGPGYIVPQAVMFSIFGFGFWQARMWPLLGYAGMIFFLLYFARRLGGWAAFVLTAVWLWCLPQLHIVFAYEGFGEHIAFFFFLLGIFFFERSLATPKRRIWLALSGAVLAFGVLTKMVTAMSGVAFAIVLPVDVWMHRKHWKRRLIDWCVFSAAFATPILGYAAFRYLYLAIQFGHEAWVAANHDFRMHMDIATATWDTFPWELFKGKFAIWAHGGFGRFTQPWWLSTAAWIVLIGSAPAFFRKLDRAQRYLLLLLVIGSCTAFGWFTFRSTSTWVRYAWIPLMSGMLLTCSVMGMALRATNQKYRFIPVLVCGLVISFFFPFDRAVPGFAISQETIDGWESIRNGTLQGIPHTPLFSEQDQGTMSRFIRQRLDPTDRIFYRGGFLVAELAPMSGRIFYPFERYVKYGNPAGGRSFVILGPYQIGKLAFAPDTCEPAWFFNDSYRLCLIR